MTTLLAINWLEIRASEVRLGKRIDELRADTNQRFTDTNQRFDELRADNRALGEKLDRLLEALLAAKQT